MYVRPDLLGKNMAASHQIASRICFWSFALIFLSFPVRGDKPRIVQAESIQLQQKRSGKQFHNERLQENYNRNAINRQNDNERQRSPQDLVSDIHCLQTSSIQTFTAFIKLPNPNGAKPVLEEVPEMDETSVCIIAETNVKGVYALDLSHLQGCGVRECTEQGEHWLCIMVRMPVMPGLKLPEDEVIDIKCKLQDIQVHGRNVISFQKNTVEQMSPTTFLGGGHDFKSEIGLFRKLPGTQLFASRVKSGSSIELGENVQLRSIVRSGDGWSFAKITDVIVHRVSSGRHMEDEKNTARLVFADGCRNPEYRVLAPINPWRDSENSLINNFDFRVFMFQEMVSGDSIMITAKVMACVEEIDCSPASCGRDAVVGYGRKKRDLAYFGGNITLDNFIPETGRTKDWQENLELKIRFPQDLQANYHQHDGHIRVSESECKLYLIITLSVAMTFCIISLSIVLFACVRRYQDIKHKRLEHSQACEEPVSNISDQNLVNKSFQNQNLALVAQDNSWTSQGISVNTSKPVTVRSVKRRDKAKNDGRINNYLNGQQQPVTEVATNHYILAHHLNQVSTRECEERAVMV